MQFKLWVKCKPSVKVKKDRKVLVSKACLGLIKC